ncbi:MAG: thermonuclease family protein [Actinobacteria bacterium]|nr:thermonuclease family protein [Actinomycetota bacterium]
MPTADLLDRAAGMVPGGDLTPWLVGAGVIALYLAYRAARMAGRLVSLGVAAALFLGAGPVGAGSLPVELPWVDQDAGEDAGSSEASDATRVPVPHEAFRAVVVRVGDGDSLHLRVTDPGGMPVAVGDELEARLLRIDAPELARDGEPAGCLADEASAALERVVPPGSEVGGSYDIERRDRYDRDLVHLWTDDGRWVNGALVAAGLARVVTFAPNTGYETEVRALETAARAARRGIWDPAVCPD